MNKEPLPPIAKPTTMLWRVVRRRCPLCGQAPLYRGWFTMHRECGHCSFRFERGPGYWLGSIYVNYGLTASIVTAAYFILYFTEAVPQSAVLPLLVAFSVLFPLAFFPFARAIWLSFDLYFDPVPADEESMQKRNSTGRQKK